MGKRLLVGATAAATVVAGLGFAGAVPAGAATGDPVLLNEVLASTTSTDSEYVELYGSPGTSLDGLSVIVTESDDQADNGAIDARFDLDAGDVIGSNGFFLLANELAEATYGVTADQLLDDSLENSSSTYALVETSSLTGGSVDDGIVVRDAVAATDGEAAEFFHFGAPVVGPDGSNLPAGVGRAEDGTDTDTPEDWFILDFNNDASVNTPTPASAKGGGGGNDKPDKRRIHEVQGAGDASPLVDDRVVVEGVVVGDEEGADPRLGGFFLQEEDKHADRDPATSEGVFVYNPGGDVVQLGDTVRVEGTVEEFFGNTQLGDVVLEVLREGSPAPRPAHVEFPLADPGDLEAVEGMAAAFPQDLVITEYFNYDRFGEVVVGLPMPGEDRPFTPTAVVDPDTDEAAAEARRTWNLNSRITIDDGLSDQNPDQVIHPINREPFTLENRFLGGDTVSGLVGPVYYSFGLHRLLPTGFGEYDRAERPESPDDVGGDLEVASMNTLNYFLTLDDGDPHCGPDGDMDCRGANTEEELQRQRAKLLNALEGLDADVIGLNELENTAGVEPLADIVAGLNERLGKNTYRYVAAGDNGVVGTDAIKVGVIYKGTSVALREHAVLDTPEFLDPLGTGEDKNRAAVAASFVEKGTGEKFSVVVNHLKSKGSGCGAGDDDQWAGSCNATRTAAAGILADWIATDPTDGADPDWMILGDLNSYDHEDPIQALEAEGYTDLVKQHVGELAFSYVFDGQWGYLDYAMSSESLTGQVTGATEWHINSPEPDILDYDVSFKSDTQDQLFDPTTPYRSSDHDAVLVGLELG